MIRVLAAAALALSLAACASHPPLAEPSGSYRALNPGRWSPTSDDLRGPRQVMLPANSPYANPPADTPAPTPETGR